MTIIISSETGIFSGMAKKKKKSRSSIGTPEPKKSILEETKNYHESDTTDEPSSVVDFLTLKLLKSSSSFHKSLKCIPQIRLTVHDSDLLDVIDGDDVLLMSSTEEMGDLKITATAIAKVQVLSNHYPPATSPIKSDDATRKLKPGYCAVWPNSLADVLSGQIEKSAQVISPSTALPSTPVSKSASTPISSSKSKFSFAQGGGGDALISPSAFSSPSRTDVTTSTTPTQKLWVISLASSIGLRAQSVFCQDATSLQLDEESSQRLGTSPRLGERLILAHLVNSYVAPNRSIRISFQGKALECSIKRLKGKSRNSDLADELSQLTLDEALSEEHAGLRKALSCVDNTQYPALFLFKVSYDTKIVFDDCKANQESTVEKALVVGLDKTLEQLETLLSAPFLQSHLFQGSLRPPRGVLLHGAGGAGKTSLALQVSRNLQKVSVHVQIVNCTSLQSESAVVGEAERHLTKLFLAADRHREGERGSLLILDDVHLICPRRKGTNPGADRLSATLLALLDGIGTNSRTTNATMTTMKKPLVILAITSNPTLLDPALRRPGRLDTEIEVPLPDEPSTRSEILQFHVQNLGATAPWADDDWLALARLAKGFTGADCLLAVKEAIRNVMLEAGVTTSDNVHLSKDVLEKSIRMTKPSAIKSITVEIPQVQWSSIGGMYDVKRELRESIELPLTHAHVFRQLRIRPPRGVLLYGPPGCSKTLMARALATEGHMNFLAVKGPELLSKWLGESERALASLFKRARLASPSVIFFDEIDAIASKRSGRSSGGERLLSQLLTELDGIQSGDDGDQKQRVVVVGATNRPDLLDSALMRPGRIDRMIYVGVPDEKSREQIFQLGLGGKSCATDIDVSLSEFASPLHDMRHFLCVLPKTKIMCAHLRSRNYLETK